MKARYVGQWSQPGALDGMLNWYRVAMNDLMAARDLGAKIEVPTLICWGEKDVAIENSCLDGTDQYVRDLRIVRFPNASHWVQQDAPDEVNAAIRNFLT